MTPADTAESRAGAQIERTARISECGTYRYWLTRGWDDTRPALLFVMLNPSTADASIDDPTIRRCVGFARRDGYGSVAVANLFAYRATDPKALLTCADAVGPLNDQYLGMALTERARRGLPTVAAWGAHAPAGRVADVLAIAPDADWRCLGVTKAGAPRHPLYVRGDQPLEGLPR
jgi:hypothetical protein